MTPDSRAVLLRGIQEATGIHGWTIEPIEKSGTGAAFVAVAGNRRLFVKWPAEVRPLSRLAEIGVAPAVVATGHAGGLSFVLQQWVDGRSVDRTWLRRHAVDVVQVMQRYHWDPVLRNSLESVHRRSAAQQRTDDLRAIQIRLAAASAQEFSRPVVQRAASRFVHLHPPLNPRVPTHGDPNPDNILLTHDGIRLIDWDSAEIADPLRDLGPLLWWFLPPDEWASTLSRYDRPLDAGPRAVEWWAARTSLLVALWIDDHSGDPRVLRSFVDDFLAAESGAANPHLAD
ncbi:phosphotransferase [Nakamurella sp. GG22]